MKNNCLISVFDVLNDLEKITNSKKISTYELMLLTSYINDLVEHLQVFKSKENLFFINSFISTQESPINPFFLSYSCIKEYAYLSAERINQKSYKILLNNLKNNINTINTDEFLKQINFSTKDVLIIKNNLETIVKYLSDIEKYFLNSFGKYKKLDDEIYLKNDYIINLSDDNPEIIKYEGEIGKIVVYGFKLNQIFCTNKSLYYKMDFDEKYFVNKKILDYLRQIHPEIGL